MPPPPSPNPADLPTDIPTATLILSHFANLKLSGDRLVNDTVTLLQSRASATTAPVSHTHAPLRRRRRRRPTRSTRVHKMSDADLEAELAARRAARARERDRYARAIRSEKLSVLENELTRLRSELSRMDRAGGIGSGTPPTARWESLPDRRRGSSITNFAIAAPSTPIPATPSPAPGPPPPPPPMASGDDVVVDPEKRRREKEERQRRREAKRREREANRKPLTLAEIIKSAGPDPMKRLKPPGSIPVGDIEAPQEAVGEDIKGAKDGLKKVSKDTDEGKQEGEGDADQSEQENDGGEDGKKDTPESGNDGLKDDAQQKNGGKESDNSKEKPEAEAVSNDLKATDKKETSEARDPKPSENQSPTKVTNTATSPEKPSTPVRGPPTQNPQKESEPGIEAEASSKGTTEPKDDAATNGTPNGSVDALAALSKLKAKLPDKAGDVNGKKDNVAERKRVSVEEKRRLRRSAKEKETKGD